MESKNSTPPRGSCLAVMGTGSDVGKSVVATALCRYLQNRGLSVAPFKAQNMSNNSGVTPEGLEMGRAQIVQAEAARIPPHVDMNPILLKPTSEVGAQVVLLGRAVANRTASQYHLEKERFWSTACQALERLRRRFDLVVLEGAGSCAEMNLLDNDLTNLRMAREAEAPVILVGDIHRGGIFAQLVGTLECLPDAQREQIAGFIVNRFRGDITLFTEGARWIETRTGLPVYGVLPWYRHFSIEAEDSVVIENSPRVHPRLDPAPGDAPAVAVVRIPHISNFTDVDPLAALEGLTVHYLSDAQSLDGFAAVILPGSKNTRWDLDWLHTSGWSAALTAYAAAGGHVLGICGGYQMLGTRVHDPEGHEGAPGTTPGLGLLPVETHLQAPKTTTRTRFAWDGVEGVGYEIHMGRTVRQGGAALLDVLARNDAACHDRDGAVEAHGRILGTYIHGLFDVPGITRRWLAGIGLGRIRVPDVCGMAARDRDYDLLAEHLARYVDMERVMGLIGSRGR